jgi:hypothetical protein
MRSPDQPVLHRTRTRTRTRIVLSLQLKNLNTETLLLRASSALFAIALVIFPMLLLIFGWLGLPGNSVATASLLAFLTVGLCGLGFLSRSAFHLSVLDVLFGLLLIPVVITGFQFHAVIEIREAELFVICGILAYVAGRSTDLEKLREVPRYTLVISVAVVAVTCAATIPELYRVWSIAEKRPIVLGFEHAVNLFAMTLAPLIFGFVYSHTDWRSIQSWAVVILIYFATALFVASLVRYTFAAIIVSIGFLLVVSIITQNAAKTYCLGLVMTAVVLGISSGLMARYSSVYSFAAEALQDSDDSRGREVEIKKRPELALGPNLKFLRVDEFASDHAVTPEQLPPSCKTEVSTSNSVSIRRALYQDSFYFVPRSGPLGIGLDNFKKVTCLKDLQVHNIYLQAIIEAGWLGGGALIALAFSPFFYLPRLIRSMDPSELSTCMFLIVGFGFAALLGLAHGTLNRELTFFLALGAISGGIARHHRRTNAGVERARTSISDRVP